MTAPVLTIDFASDVDGVRHIVLPREAPDCSSWIVLVWAAHEDPKHDPPRREARFEQQVVWGERANFLGIGERREGWVAVVDRDEIAEVEIAGVRHVIEVSS